MKPLTVTQAAQRLATSGRNVRRMIQAGQLRAVPVNPRLYLIEEREVERAKSRPGPGRPRRKQNMPISRDLRSAKRFAESSGVQP